MYYGKNAFSLLLRYTLAHEIEEWGWDIGDHTYGAKGSPIIIEAEYAGLKIGKYCSIAREVLMILGNHRPDTITTYPFKNQCNFWPEAADATDDDIPLDGYRHRQRRLDRRTGQHHVGCHHRIRRDHRHGGREVPVVTPYCYSGAWDQAAIA